MDQTTKFYPEKNSIMFCLDLSELENQVVS